MNTKHYSLLFSFGFENVGSVVNIEVIYMYLKTVLQQTSSSILSFFL